MDNPYILPADLAEMTGDFAAIGQTIYGRQCRKRDAIQAVKDRYWSLRNRLAARMEAEIRRIEARHG